VIFPNTQTSKKNPLNSQTASFHPHSEPILYSVTFRHSFGKAEGFCANWHLAKPGRPLAGWSPHNGADFLSATQRLKRLMTFHSHNCFH